jgi:probable rRNA maturation factor
MTRVAARVLAIRSLHPRLRLNRREVAQALRVLDENAVRLGCAAPPGELSIVFLTDPALARLHAEFLADPTPTDVITFVGAPGFGTAGEICLSADAAARFATAHRRSFAEELTLYLAHGWLHLAGHDDLQPAKKRAMRRAEARAMRVLREAQAVPSFAFGRKRLSPAPRR